MDRHDRRRAMRCPSRYSVHVVIDGLQLEAPLRNLSEAGCMLELGAAEVDVGSLCSVVLRPDFPVSGRIAWRLGDAAGIAFHQPVPQGIVRDYALDDWLLRRA